DRRARRLSGGLHGTAGHPRRHVWRHRAPRLRAGLRLGTGLLGIEALHRTSGYAGRHIGRGRASGLGAGLCVRALDRTARHAGRGVGRRR
ncbi:hypothetical protein, partial [Methylobacterium sp. WL64]|uniref:hypothetical protein n=1 Tax=Methylobacterium sp. WL64 TaxID=2603894 RepID=UPI00164FD9DF